LGKTNEQYKYEISQLEAKTAKYQKEMEALKSENEDAQKQLIAMYERINEQEQ